MYKKLTFLDNAVTAVYLSSFKMSYVAKDKEYDAAGAVPPAKIHKIRITLTSSKVGSLEKCELALSFDSVKIAVLR